MAHRGSYAKGVAKREEIIQRALEVIERDGYAATSVKALAEAVGLSQAGLLHYFSSKEELFTEIVRKRDDADYERWSEAARYQTVTDVYVEIIAHNAEVPGLVQLFSRLSAEAADPAHAAHDYFLARGERIRESIHASAADAAPGSLLHRDPDTYARLLQAVSDGLQLQWLVDPSIDMAHITRILIEELDAPPASPSGATP